MAKKTKGKTKSESERRFERRFVAQSSANATLVKGLGALSALILGAGAWAYLYGQSFVSDEKLRALPSYLVAGGAVLLGITIWIGTSSEPPIRVGAAGIAVEKGDRRRMPWWAVDTITFDPNAMALVVTGKDESGAAWTFEVSTKTHADAVSWIIDEARERVPRRIDIGDDVIETLPRAAEGAGTKIELEPLQVVGKKDALTGKVISYEPDARVCRRCERVYSKTSVPKKCKCGNSLVHLHSKVAEDTSNDETADGAHEAKRASKNAETSKPAES